MVTLVLILVLDKFAFCVRIHFNIFQVRTNFAGIQSEFLN